MPIFDSNLKGGFLGQGIERKYPRDVIDTAAMAVDWAEESGDW